MILRLTRTASIVALASIIGFAAAPVSAAPRHHGKAHVGVKFAKPSAKGGYQTLVSDGPGSGYGFHRLPGPYRVGARVARNRQSEALRETVDTDLLTHGGYRSGFPGDSVYGNQPYSSYGVFSGADSYGSPYFAGFYGLGDGEDLGPLGTTYDND